MTSRILFVLVLVLAVAAGYAWGSSGSTTMANTELCRSMQQIQHRASALRAFSMDALAAADKMLTLTKRVSVAAAAVATHRPPAEQAAEGRPEEYQPAEAAPY